MYCAGGRIRTYEATRARRLQRRAFVHSATPAIKSLSDTETPIIAYHETPLNFTHPPTVDPPSRKVKGGGKKREKELFNSKFEIPDS